MKNRIIAVITLILFAMFCVLSVSGIEERSKLFDGADLLTEQEEAMLEERLKEVSETYLVEILIATVSDTGDYSVDSYVEMYYDQGGYGYGENKDGVLLLLSMAERDYRILSNGLGADAISDDDIDYIGDIIVSYLSDGEYAEGFLRFIDECEYEINGEINGFPFEFGVNLLIAVVVGFVSALIVTLIMKAQLKSVKFATGANDYVKTGSLNITQSQDLFLYHTVSKVKRETSSSSSGSSGSSRNVGGGKF